MSQQDKVMYVIAHTHWDREWYGTFQQYRIRLVRLTNKFLKIVQDDPDFVFNFDGQTVVLEDFLEAEPAKREQIKELVEAKRIMIGPWYVLPDEFLVDGESYMRNLLLGDKIANDFGHRNRIGYIPDTFGHIAQLPQILREFDLDTTMHFRGMNPRDRSELWWEAPDGSRVLLHHMPNWAGYTDAVPWPEEWPEALIDIESLVEIKSARAATDVLVAMSGVDHLEPRADLPGLLHFAEDRLEGVEFKLTSLEDYAEALNTAVTAAGAELETVKGELRDVPRQPHAGNILLYNVLSSRIDNKLWNFEASRALERWGEPFSALAWVEGFDPDGYPEGLLWTAWRWLLKNHPHDSIGGCSADEIHRQMNTRFEWAYEIGEYLAEEKFRLLARELDFSGLNDDEYPLIVFNPSPWDREEVITLDVDIPGAWLQRRAVESLPTAPEIKRGIPYPILHHMRTRKYWAGNPPLMPEVFFRGMRVRPVGGEEVPVEVHSIEERDLSVSLADGPTGAYRVARVNASFPVKVPAFGYALLGVRTTPRPNKYPGVDLPPNVIRNEYLEVEVHPNGTFALTDRESGQVFDGLGYFEDGGDSGDGYTYSYPQFDDRVYTTVGAAPRIARVGLTALTQTLRVEYDLELPAGLDVNRQFRRDETVTCPLTVDLTLRPGARTLELAVTFDNHAKDHRLRMLFPTDLATTTTAESAMQFDVITRNTVPVPVDQDVWIEDAPDTFPQHGWTSLYDADIKRGLAVIAGGVHEFGVPDTEERPIALTLLRAVGYLGAGRDPMTINGGAGPHIPTPEAQLLQKFTYNIALRPHSAPWDAAEIWRDAEEFLLPMKAITEKPTEGGTRKPSASFLSIEGANVVLSAVKGSEDGEGVIVRVYNPSERSSAASIKFNKVPGAAFRTNAREHAIETLTILRDGSFRVDVPAKKIVTVKATF